MPDFTVTDLGTLWQIRTLTPAATEWVEQNVEMPDYMGNARTFNADWRQGRNIVEGMQADGLIAR